MIGILGGYAVILETAPGVLSAFPAADGSGAWDSVAYDRGGWGGASAPVVPVSGLYAATLYFQAFVANVGANPVEWHGMAFLNAGGSIAKVDVGTPAGDLDGLATYGAAASSFLIELAAGDPIEWGYSIGDVAATADHGEVSVIRLSLGRVR